MVLHTARTGRERVVRSRNFSTRIREIIAEQLGSTGLRYQHSEIMSNVTWPEEIETMGGAEVSRQVVSAMSYWIDSDLNVRGVKCTNIAEPGRYRLYEFRPAIQAPTRPKAADKPDLAFMVLKLLNDGRMLLQSPNGDMWVAKKMDI